MIFAVLLGVAICLSFLFNKYLFCYWSRRGFKQIDPKPIFGDVTSLMLLKATAGETFGKFYDKYHKTNRIIGMYLSYRPALLVTDSKLVQDIMIKDFTYFTDRPMPVDADKDPLSAHLFSIAGQQWRDLRVKISPTFTSGKLKGMFSIMKDCGDVLEKYLETNVKNGVDVFEFRDLMARFNTNIISSVGFGIENDCINEPNHVFRKMGAKFFDINFMNGIRQTVTFLNPKKFHKLGLRIVDKDVEEFMFSIIKQTVDHREQKNFTRNDFMQLLIQLKDQGYVSVDKGEKESEEVKSKNVSKIDMKQLVAQAYVFFIAGFETSSTTLSFCLFELARNPELQKKAQHEIDLAFKTNQSEGITYDKINDLKYTECCIDETLRKYPIVPALIRTATRDYKISDSDLTIPEGTPIYIPLYSLQRDPEIYDEPMEFRPERFSNSSNGGGKAKGLFYSPFGDGPRNCVGMRLGKLITKMGLALIFSKYNVELADKEMNHGELEFHPNQFVLTPIKPFNIKISPRK